MSRAALEWAKAQPTNNPTHRVVLLVLADEADGRDHSRTAYIDGLLKATGLTLDQFTDALDALESNDLVQGRLCPTKSGTDAKIAFRLLVPSAWQPSPLGVVSNVPRAGGGRPEEDCPNGVYRLYDMAGELLYVGVTAYPARRLQEHEADKYWWPEVVTRDITWYNSRRAGEAAEDVAIWSERPKYNAQESHRPIDGAPPVHGRRKRRYSVVGSSYAKHERLVIAIGDAILAGEFNKAPLPEAGELAERFEATPLAITRALKTLKINGIISDRNERADRYFANRFYD